MKKLPPLLLLAAISLSLFFARSDSYLAVQERLQHFVNGPLMAIFFFLIGQEIRHEIKDGELSRFKVAALPVVGALGGMILPATIYWLLNHGGESANGWAVAMPTDLALVLGTLGLLGSRIAPALRIFLLALAVADDLFSITILGLFYSHGIEAAEIIFSIGAVALGLSTKINERLRNYILEPMSSLVIIPLYVFLNFGFVLDFSLLQTSTSQGLIAGRLIGKALGITLFVWIAIKLRVGHRPDSLSWPSIWGGSILAAMGLTVSLFIAEISLSSAQLLDRVRMGLLVTIVVSAVLGSSVLAFEHRRDRR